MTLSRGVRVLVEFYHLPQFGGGRHLEEQVFPPGTTVAEVLAHYGLLQERGLTQLLNGRYVQRDQPVTDGSRLTILYQSQGG